MKVERDLVKNQNIYNKESFYYVVTLIAEHDDWIRVCFKKLRNGNYMSFVDNVLYLGQLLGEGANLDWPSKVNKLANKN